jgi:hypothetical protein
MKTFTNIAVALFALVASASSWAGLIFFPSNNPQPDEVTVLLNSGESGAIVYGTFAAPNNSFVVDFTSTSGSGLLSEPTTTPARITGGTGNDPFQNLTFSLESGATFSDAIFDIRALAVGNVSLTAMTSDNFTGNAVFALGTGINFFTIVAVNGEQITQVNLTTSDTSFTDVRNIRLSGLTGSSAVPESGTTLVLLGTGVIALALLRRNLARS